MSLFRVVVPRTSCWASPAGIVRSGRSERDETRENAGHADLFVDGGLGKIEADGGGVALRLAAFVVMNLEEDVGARRQIAGDAVGEAVGRFAGSPSIEFPLGQELEVTEGRIARGGVRGVELAAAAARIDGT